VQSTLPLRHRATKLSFISFSFSWKQGGVIATIDRTPVRNHRPVSQRHVSLCAERVCLYTDCDESRSKVRCGTLSADEVSSQCVDVRVWCNGNADCDDASDETLCHTGQRVKGHRSWDLTLKLATVKTATTHVIKCALISNYAHSTYGNISTDVPIFKLLTVKNKYDMMTFKKIEIMLIGCEINLQAAQLSSFRAVLFCFICTKY